MVTEERIHTDQASVSIKKVEDKIRNAVNVKKVRCTEFFKDFDRLRTGYISKAQFERCLDQLFSVQLSPLETNVLLSKYGSNPQQTGMVCYRDFCAAIDATFDGNILHKAPDTQRVGSAASDPVNRRPLSPASLSKYDYILSRCAAFYKYHGIIVKSSYADFDKHNNGLVTESQFYRSFPGPPDIVEAEMRLVARKHRHPDKAGLCNYLQFHEDVVQRQQDIAAAGDEKVYLGVGDQKILDTVALAHHFQEASRGSDLGAIFEKIRIAVYKNGVRTTEFFRDHDKLRSGIITENQFVCGLSLCCGTIANLSREEIQQVVDFYRTEDGRVQYKEFCHMMENAFTEPELEKKPTTQMLRPPVGALMKVPNTLSAHEERQVQEILDRLASDVRRRRLMVYPFFKDFDRSKAYTRGITKPQFERMLHVLSLNLQANELVLICKKFEYPVGGDVNYPAFIQAIDPEYVASSKHLVSDDDFNKYEEVPPPPPLDLTTVDLGELIGRIRHHVLTNRIRVEEYFQDFDPLRSGSISKSHFRRGLSSLGQHQLTDAQFEVMALHYSDPKRAGNVIWTLFLKNIEEVFTRRGLEKIPTFEVPASETFLMEKPGAKNDLGATALLDQCMHRLRERTKQRRLLAKPCFQDFDKHNNGHVTKSQFRQCLQHLELNATVQEMEAIEEKFSDNIGVNYIRFLEELQPTEKEANRYTQRLEELKLVNSKIMPDHGSEDVDRILQKIKNKVVKERIRVLEFMRDYDKLRSGRMLKTCFSRALDLCQLGLTKKEVDILTKVYTSSQDPDYVDYVEFSDYVESIFTLKHLEKNPLVEPVQYRPEQGSDLNRLAQDANEMFEKVMHRLADRVRQRRVQMFPLFEDYDRIHNGTVSRGQFRRVLSELDLGSMVSSREFTVLYQKFDVLIGGKHDFNYIAFCDLVNEYALFEHGKP